MSSPVDPLGDDLDLRHFANECRLFPLPGLVLFPNAVLPLHIFEPRYREMTRDALATDRLVTIVQLRPSIVTPGSTLGTPPIATVGCLGRIIQHERLPDGRFNFLLLGRKRVRLLHEIPSEKLYRIARVEILEDEEGPEPIDAARLELVRLFRAALELRNVLDDDMARLLDGPVSLGTLTDIVAHALGTPTELKQHLLGETSVSRRAQVLLHILRQSIGASETSDKGPAFPPRFSPN